MSEQHEFLIDFCRATDRAWGIGPGSTFIYGEWNFLTNMERCPKCNSTLVSDRLVRSIDGAMTQKEFQCDRCGWHWNDWTQEGPLDMAKHGMVSSD